MIRALYRRVCNRVIRPGLGGLNDRLVAAEGKLFDLERRLGAARPARCVWRGGLAHGHAEAADGVIDDAATARLRGELGFWCDAFRRTGELMPDVHDLGATVRGWHGERLHELRAALGLVDWSALETWGCRTTSVPS